MFIFRDTIPWKIDNIPQEREKRDEFLIKMRKESKIDNLLPGVKKEFQNIIKYLLEIKKNKEPDVRKIHAMIIPLMEPGINFNNFDWLQDPKTKKENSSESNEQEESNNAEGRDEEENDEGKGEGQEEGREEAGENEGNQEQEERGEGAGEREEDEDSREEEGEEESGEGESESEEEEEEGEE